MSEICTPLLRVNDGESYTAEKGPAYVIEDHHTHGDILRYIIADVGKAHALAILSTLPDKPAPGAARPAGE